MVEAWAAIRERFESQWTATPIAWPNRVFDPPAEEPWVRFAISMGEGFQVDLNPNPRERHPGVVIVQVFTPLDKGTGAGELLGEDVAAVFRRWSTTFPMGSVLFQTPSVLYAGKRDGWAQHNVRAPFWFDEIA